MTEKLLKWIIVAAMAGWGLYFVWGVFTAPLAGASTPFVDEITKRLSEIRKIQKVSQNLGILNDKLFQALQASGAQQFFVSGTSTVPTASAKGRPNPFIPF